MHVPRSFAQAQTNASARKRQAVRELCNRRGTARKVTQSIGVNLRKWSVFTITLKLSAAVSVRNLQPTGRETRSETPVYNIPQLRDGHLNLATTR